MRIVVHGQEAFGKAVLEKLLERKENVVAVFLRARQGRPRRGSAQAVRDREGPARAPAEELEDARGARADEVVQCRRVHDGLRDAVRAAAGARCAEARHVPVPSLAAAAHRGPSSINWPIAMGKTRTGLSIFWPDEGLDEGPILLQKTVEIGPDETLGDVYFKKLFPIGVDAMMEALGSGARRRDAKHRARPLPRLPMKAGSRRTWPRSIGPSRSPNLQPDPRRQSAPGRLEHDQGPEGRYLRQRRRRPARASPAKCSRVDDKGMTIAAGGGAILAKRVRGGDGKKVAAAEWAKAAGVKAGDTLRQAARTESRQPEVQTISRDCAGGRTHGREVRYRDRARSEDEADRRGRQEDRHSRPTRCSTTGRTRPRSPSTSSTRRRRTRTAS